MGFFLQVNENCYTKTLFGILIYENKNILLMNSPVSG